MLGIIWMLKKHVLNGSKKKMSSLVNLLCWPLLELPFGSGNEDGFGGHNEYFEMVRLALRGSVWLRKEP